MDPFLRSIPLFAVGVVSAGVVSVLLVSTSVVVRATNVSVVAGKVIVTSAVLAGPINVALLVPLSLSSKNSINPALVAPFLSCIPAFAIGVVSTGVVRVLLVRVSDPVKETKLSLCSAELNSAKDPVKLFPVPPRSNVLFVNVSVVALPTSVSAAAGSKTVTSAVLAGPCNVTPFVPLFVPSKNLIVPAALVLAAPIINPCPVAVVVLAAIVVILSVPSTSMVTLPVPESTTATLLFPA